MVFLELAVIRGIMFGFSAADNHLTLRLLHGLIPYLNITVSGLTILVFVGLKCAIGKNPDLHDIILSFLKVVVWDPKIFI